MDKRITEKVKFRIKLKHWKVNENTVGKWT